MSRAKAPPKEISFDEWAGLSARLLKRPKDVRRAILREADMDPVDWEREDARHGAALAEEMGEGREELALRYGEACARELERRKKEELEASAALVAAPPPSPEPAAEAPPPMPSIPEVRPMVSPPLPLSPSLPPFLPPPPPAPVWQEEPTLTGAARALPDAPLPFRPGAVNPELFEAPRSVQAVDPGETLTFVGSDGPVPSTPFGEQLTLEQFASIVVELERAPDARQAVLVRYGLRDERAYYAVDEAYKTRFRAQPSTHTRWLELCAEYRDWFERGGR